MSRKIQYECPTCKTINNAEVTNCIKCGHWMHSTAYPPKIIRKKSVIGRIFRILGVITSSIIGLFILLFVVVSLINQNKTEEAGPEKSIPTVNVNSPKTKEQLQGSRSNPIPIGTTKSFGVEQFSALTGLDRHQFVISIQVNKSIRGNEANTKVKAWNEFNSEPKKGFEYLLVNITIGVTESKDDAPLNVNQNVFSLVSSDGIKYDTPFVVIVDAVYAEMYEGSKHTGWAAFLVRTDDSNPLIEVAGMWFATL